MDSGSPSSKYLLIAKETRDPFFRHRKYALTNSDQLSPAIKSSQVGKLTE
jgi:hypothetical protein